MTILHLATFLQGGAGRMIASLAADQHRVGHRVTVVASRTGPSGYGNYTSYIEQLTRCGVSVHLVDSMFARDHALNLAVVRLLDRLFSAGEEPDVIHAHAAIPSLVALTFAGSRAHPMTIVQTMHGWGVTKTPAQSATDATLLNLVHRVAVPSRHAGRQLASLGVSPARTTVVPYGVSDAASDLYIKDRALIDEMASARQTGALVMASVGTIGARKNQRAIVDALRLDGGQSNAWCVFVGDGDSSDLAAAIDAAGVAERCRIRGYSSAARQIAAAADVLVLPSRSEGQPVSVLEAFADGTLVAVSDIPELVELVADGVTGVVFGVDDPGSLAAAVARIAGMSRQTREGIQDRARGRYLSTFTATGMAARYQDFYTQALHERRSALAGRTLPQLHPAGAFSLEPAEIGRL